MEASKIKRLKDLDKAHVWHPFTQMQEYVETEPLVIERGEGVYLYDIEGRRYIDGVSSLWVNVHGHHCAKLHEAIKAQLDQVAHSTLLGIANVPSTLLAEKLIEITPKNLNKVFYSDSGSTSVEIAIKMAFQYWQQQGGEDKKKTRFVSLVNAYHGDTLGSVSVGGMDLFHEKFRPLLFDSLKIANFDFKQAEEIFSKYSGEIAACIVEPLIQGAAGMRLQPKGFLSHLRKLCDRHGVFLICDEVATGFGRTGKMFAIQHEGVNPDFLCLAKGITGGYLPLAATLTTDRIFEGFAGAYQDFRTFFHGHSYTGNPLACAAALANLEIFEKEKIIDSLQEKIKFLQESLLKFQSHPKVKEVRQLGMMVGIELVDFPIEEKMACKICMCARGKGALLRPLGDVLVLMPPLSISTDEIRLLTDILYESLEETME